MWAGLGTLLLLSTALGVSSMLAGSVPLVFSLSRRHIKLLAACGAGILMGTALIVIIPEGVEALYSVETSGAATAHRFQTRSLEPAWGLKRAVSWEHIHARQSETLATLTGPDDGRPKDVPQRDAKEPVSTVTPEDDHEFEPHAWVGVSLIAGFVLMYLIDKLPKLALTQNRLRPAYISLRGMGLRRGTALDEEGEDMAAEPHTHEEGFGPSSTTTGLVIHAAADGIALGASSASSSPRLGMVIFLALMIHKAPAAFGLTTILLKQGLSKRAARTHLLIFSLAAPVGALVTWAIANIVGASAVDAGAQTTFITSLLLLFSGGTFLYVAMHTMQDGAHDHAPQDTSNGTAYSEIYQPQPVKEAEGPTMVDTLAMVGGMLLPLLTQVNHSH